MIYIEMNGRLGNQLFRYAFARMIQLQGGETEELMLDFSNVYKEQKKGEMTGWEDSLRHFHVAPYRYYEEGRRILLSKTTLSEKFVLGIMRAGDLWAGKRGTKAKLRWRKRFLSWENRHGIYLLFTGYDFPFQWKKTRRKIVSGPFECAAYPESIKQVLQREIIPIYPVLEKNLKLLRKIQSVNSVCVSVRRGNYIQYPALDVCTPGYFERAAREMRRLVKDPVFFMFSDEIGWVRENLHIPGEVYYEDGDDPVWEKLRLMYSCRHFIISNSTFSWWAQFLGKCGDKVVIAPEVWFRGEYQPPLFEKGWHRMNI